MDIVISQNEHSKNIEIKKILPRNKKNIKRIKC